MHEDTYIAGNPDLNGSESLVVVTGCSGGGKSSLLNEMAIRGYQIYPEPGRQIVKEQRYIGGDGLPWDNAHKFIDLCVSRAVFFYNSAQPGDKPALFDRSFIDNVAGLPRLGEPMPSHFQETIRKYRYAKRVFMVPPWPELFTQDEERRHSFEDAAAEYESLLTVYRDYGYEVVLIPKGTVPERADFLEAQLLG